MKDGKVYYFALTLMMIMSCAKIDRIPPTINSLNVNGLSADTVHIAPSTLNINFEITDNELIQGSRLRLREQANPSSGFQYLSIQEINSSYNYSELTVIVPDSVRELNDYFTLTLDAFDNSGNQAKQKKIIINFR